MTRTLRRLIVLCALTIAIAIGGAHDARAGEAGLVIEHGDGSVIYVLIVFPEDELKSIDLLKRSGISLATVSAGGLGEAVCTIDNEGCGVSDCRVRLCQTGDPESPFWKFFRAGEDGLWIVQPLGASGTTVRGGEVDLWAWTGGDATIPTVDIAGVSAFVGAPDSRPEEAVYVAWYDADGNEMPAPGTDSSQQNPWIGGIALLAIAAISGVLLARRSRSRTLPGRLGR